jgi:hypothetical protein
LDVCAAKGFLKWKGEENGPDFDGVQCVVIFTLPVLPLRAYHSSQRGGVVQLSAIRLSLSLIIHAFLRRWLLVPLIVGCVMLLWTLIGKSDINPVLISGGLIFTPVLMRTLLSLSDQRNEQIRRLIADRHRSSDPVTWKKRTLATISAPQDLFGSFSYVEAVRLLMDKGNYPQAMWAARYATALEDRIQGELLTDEVLAHPDVKDLVATLRGLPPGEAANMESAIV